MDKFSNQVDPIHTLWYGKLEISIDSDCTKEKKKLATYKEKYELP